jgi:hypothetical protein
MQRSMVRVQEAQICSVTPAGTGLGSAVAVKGSRPHKTDELAAHFASFIIHCELLYHSLTRQGITLRNLHPGPRGVADTRHAKCRT